MHIIHLPVSKSLLINKDISESNGYFLMQRESEVSLYLKTVTLRDINDMDLILEDIKHNTILIIRVTPLAQKNIDDLKMVIEELYKFVRSTNGDIARLGEERLVITPPSVKIWKNMYDKST